MMKEKYIPKDIEIDLYNKWEKFGYFKPHIINTKKRYCITIPPPNVTGNLHMGHALQQTIMDILIRYHRMQGKNTLWQSGLDHAGIAMQAMIEKELFLKEGKIKEDFNRKDFIKKILIWKDKFSKNITMQMRRLGNSIDWDRNRFTLDSGLSEAVKEAFIILYEKNLIYRKQCLVNWDTKLKTAISDLEIVNKESKGYMWYLKYQLCNGKRTFNNLNYLVVATTRPETIFGDVCIAVNPKDERYQNLIGNFVVVPLINRLIPIICDNDIDMHKGTGCVKITPAHDFNDYKIGMRNSMPMINIFTIEGKIRKEIEIFNAEKDFIERIEKKIPNKFQELERFYARKIIIKDLEQLKLIEKKENHILSLSYSDRSNAITEPILTTQWYIRTFTLAKNAINVVKNGRIKFFPEEYKNMYFSWMKNVKDWCISRQLWWGHRIPVWYDKEKRIYVGRNESEIRKKYKINKNVKLNQEEDVLDTWFSSGLWTFSSLGWPKKTIDLKIFHPTDVIVSGFDIIFFWIARMIMLTTYLIKDSNGNIQIPFKTVYITGLIRDEHGKKMSKSNGNIIDPIDMIDGISLKDLIEKRTKNIKKLELIKKIVNQTKSQFPNGIKSHSADALRLTVSSLSSKVRNINWDMHRFNGHYNFCNKLWNAGKFVIMHLEKEKFNLYKTNKNFSSIDFWILGKFNQTIKIFRKYLDQYRFDLLICTLHEFFWDQFCNWYIEFVKVKKLNCNSEQLFSTNVMLIKIFESLLRLAHPIIPFITEYIWQKIKSIANISGETIMLQSFPIYEEKLINLKFINDIEWIKKVIIYIRNIRSTMNITSNKNIIIFFRNENSNVIRRIKENIIFIKVLAKVKEVNFLSLLNKKNIKFTISCKIDEIELLVSLKGLINIKDELENINMQLFDLNEKIKFFEEKIKEKYTSCNHSANLIRGKKKLNVLIEKRNKILKKRSIIYKLNS